MTEPEMIDSLRVHRFEPGDRLIIKLPAGITFSTAALVALEEDLKKWAPGVPVLLLDAGTEIEVARGLPSEGESPT